MREESEVNAWVPVHIVGYVSWAVVDDEPELNLHREYFCRTESGEHSFCVDQVVANRVQR